jgi:hypothetical protein
MGVPEMYGLGVKYRGGSKGSREGVDLKSWCICHVLF